MMIANWLLSDGTAFRRWSIGRKLERDRKRSIRIRESQRAAREAYPTANPWTRSDIF
jgi:hypothetical protein